MALTEKLERALDLLRNPENVSRRKENILHCISIADTMCNPHVKTAKNFLPLLSMSIETLLVLCDDAESDTRMVADESLNRIIRAMTDSHIVKVQIELHKEIKLNRNARSLRAALSRFAQLSHYIKPQKGKPYITYLIPCLIKVSQRPEDSVYETFTESLPKIMQSLGRFTTDSDIKGLIKASVDNLIKESAVKRRLAATNLLTLCLYSRKPQFFLEYILNSIVDIILPVDLSQPCHVVLGVMAGIRSLLPTYFTQNNSVHFNVNVEKCLEIFQFSLYYTSNPDHNIINSALEVLNTVLQLAPKQVTNELVKPGLATILVHANNCRLRSKTMSIMSVAQSSASIDENALMDNEVAESVEASVSKWIMQSKLTSGYQSSNSEIPLNKLSKNQQSFDQLDSPMRSTNDSICGSLCDTSDFVNIHGTSYAGDYGNDLDLPLSDHVHKESSFTNKNYEDSPDETKVVDEEILEGVNQINVSRNADIEIEIGNFTDPGVLPIVYCVRHLCKKFLLAGSVHKVIADNTVRVSVKVLALNCIANIVKLKPELLTIFLDKNIDESYRKDCVNVNNIETCEKDQTSLIKHLEIKFNHFGDNQINLKCKEAEKDNSETKTSCEIDTSLLSEKYGKHQVISDLLLFHNHADPQLRGIIRIVIGNFIRTVIVSSDGDYKRWLMSTNNHFGNVLNLADLIQLLIVGLKDSIQTCCRQSLTAVQTCITCLTEQSAESEMATKIYLVLPLIAHNPYWLVKVKLTEVLTELSYGSIWKILGPEFQTKILNEVVYALLSDEDHRVRKKSAEALCKILPKLYFTNDYECQNIVSNLAIEMSMNDRESSEITIPPIKNIVERRLFDNVMHPFNVLTRFKVADEVSEVTFKKIESNLSRVVFDLTQFLYDTRNKNFTYGILLAVNALMSHFPTTLYSTWVDSGLLDISLQLVTASTVQFNLTAHNHLLNIVSNLLCASALKQYEIYTPLEPNKSIIWHHLIKPNLSNQAELYLNHIMKCLNIFCHIIDDVNPTVVSQKPQIPTTPSKKNIPKVEVENKPGVSSIHTKGKGFPMGYFANGPAYLKLCEILKSAYGNYKVTIDNEASEKFLTLLKTTLDSLSQLLEISTIVEIGRISEEILSHMKTTMQLESTSTIKCVQQLLKCLFGTNFGCLYEHIKQFIFCPHSAEYPSKQNEDINEFSEMSLKSYDTIDLELNCLKYESFYDQILSFQSTNVSKKCREHCINPSKCKTFGFCTSNYLTDNVLTIDLLYKEYENVHDYLKRKVDPKWGADQTSLASYIRLFEPMVIQGLKQYTVTSDVILQAQVLKLLCQLLQLRVNYCLLDSDEIFIKHVLKQFEYIEQGQIQHSEILIPQVLYFLLHLSYEKYHSKSIMAIPKILQLCDGLIASEQLQLTHCVPAIIPLAEDVFLMRANNKLLKSESVELATTKEVVFAMLLRLIEYSDIINTFSMILTLSRQTNENYERWSRQALDGVLNTIQQNKLQLTTDWEHASLGHFFDVLHPEAVFNTEIIQTVLSCMFTNIKVKMYTNHYSQWFCTVALFFWKIIKHIPEKDLLSHIDSLKRKISLQSVFFCCNNESRNSDPLNASKATNELEHIPADVIFVRFIFRVIHCTVQLLNDVVPSMDEPPHKYRFLIKRFVGFLNDVKTIFEESESNKFSIISQTASNIIQNETFGHNVELYDKNENIPIDQINEYFIKLAAFTPILTSHWCHFLIKIKYGDLSFWDIVLYKSNSVHKIFNLEIVKTAALLSYCEYFSRNGISDCEQLSWLLVNHMKFLITLAKEQPVKTMLMSVTNNKAASELLVQAINTRCGNCQEPSFINNLLPILHSVHPSQSGAILSLCIPRLINNPNLSLARRAAILCCRRAEILRTLETTEVHEQLHKDDFVKLLDQLIDLKLAKKHGTLVSILNKLSTQFYDLSPLELSYARPVNPENIKTTKLDGTWYSIQVKLKCCQTYSQVQCNELAELLYKLSDASFKSVIICKDFNKQILRSCLKIGSREFLDNLDKKYCTKYRDFQLTNHDAESMTILNPFLTSTIACVLKNVDYVTSLTPRAHCVYNPVERTATNAEMKHTNRCNELFEDESFCEIFHESIIPLISYLETVEKIHNKLRSYSDMDTTIVTFPMTDTTLLRFAVLCLEHVLFIINKNEAKIGIVVTENTLFRLALKCADLVLKQTQLWQKLNTTPKFNTYICSALNALYKLVEFISKNESEYIVKEPLECLKPIMKNTETAIIGYASHHAANLITWIEIHNKKNRSDNRCNILSPIVERQSILLSMLRTLCRFDLVNSYAVTPAEVWSRGWEVIIDKHPYKLPPVPIEFLQDSEVLESFVFRSMLLGWISRHQFEETWMCLLGVLSCTQTSSELLQSQRVSIEAIARLLLSSLLLPYPGNPNVSKYLHLPRHSKIKTDNIGLVKLKAVQDLIVTQSIPNFHLSNIFNQPNVEHISWSHFYDGLTIQDYTYGQLSISYLSRIVNLEEFRNGNTHNQYSYREKCLESSGIDLNSCLQFLVDLFSQMLSVESNISTQLVHVVLQSTLSISDLFQSSAQFRWALDTSLELSRTIPQEDELSHQYITLLACKSAAVVLPDWETLENLRTIIYQSLRSLFTPSRTAAVHGLLYVLESLVLSNTVIGGYNPDTLLMYAIAKDYIDGIFSEQNISCGVSQLSRYHTLSTWALAFFLFEHFDDNIIEGSLSPTILQHTLTALKVVEINNAVYLVILKGVERLIVMGKITGSALDSVVKISLEKLKNTQSIVMLPALQLLVTCVYTAASEQLHSTELSNGIVENDPEIIVRSIEKATAIFDRIKKAVPFEAKILCNVLSRILNDLFPPSEILTKVVGEFLSTNQPHCQLMAGVVVQVFSRARECSQLALLQAWLVCSLPNFTSNLSPNMSAWCLTCFFLGASTNEYLSNLFPYVQSRMGQLEYEDRKMLCLAANDFYKNLTKDQKIIFVANFEPVAKESCSPFKEMLNSLQS